MNSIPCAGTIFLYSQILNHSIPPISGGDFMDTIDLPPTRKSISALGQVNRSGPHQRITRLGSVHTFHTCSGVASKIRVTSITFSIVFAFSFIHVVQRLARQYLPAGLEFTAGGVYFIFCTMLLWVSLIFLRILLSVSINFERRSMAICKRMEVSSDISFMASNCNFNLSW